MTTKSKKAAWREKEVAEEAQSVAAVLLLSNEQTPLNTMEAVSM